MTREENWNTDRYSAADIQDSPELMRKTFGESELATSDYQEWQLQRNPAGAAIGVRARDKETGRLIGQALTVPISVRLSGKVHTASLCLNPVTDPDCQDRDVSNSLLRDVCALSAEEGAVFTYAFPDQASYSAFVNRAGFKDVRSIPLLIRPLNPERLALKTAGSGVATRAASIARMVWRTPSPWAQKEELPGLEIEQVASFDEPFALFWHRVQHRCPVMVERDPAYLNWRYLDVPGREYAVFAAKSEGKIRGFVAARAASLGRFSVGLIVDLVVEASGEGRAAGRHLVDHAGAYLRDHDPDMLATIALRHTDEFRIFRSRGFWLSPKFLEPHPFHLVVRSHDEKADLAYDLRNWFLTLGDSLVV